MEKIKNFWRRNDQKILISMAIFLVAIVSFRAGETYKEKKEMAEIKISLIDASIASNPKEEEIKVLNKALERNVVEVEKGNNEKIGENKKSENGINEQKECTFVGSKNSDKYHLPSCRYATKIKESNLVCFSSAEDAKAKGYQAAKCCIK